MGGVWGVGCGWMAGGGSQETLVYLTFSHSVQWGRVAWGMRGRGRGDEQTLVCQKQILGLKVGPCLGPSCGTNSVQGRGQVGRRSARLGPMSAQCLPIMGLRSAQGRAMVGQSRSKVGPRPFQSRIKVGSARLWAGRMSADCRPK